ncbi:hypothetical protein [Streptomyces sp. NBC_00620]|uniref:hypothetical protein n=1 Tax=Streptomyces sp. NBC_00620 TaxID=2903666 RepID=UPI002250BD80|nr:hypothetical protein [Streptomyces sp. NBC_00620]MCX4973150.1 hypothetical protein [Streptomyces sp. NBC_00620]
MAETERLDGRDGKIWTAYVGGATQEAIAAEHGISQQRVSQVLAEVRDSIGEAVRMDAALLAQERADALLAAVWPAAREGDTKAVLAALRVLERMAKATGTDAVEPLRVTLERRLDLEGALIGEALGAALDAVPELSHEQRVAALTAAQAKLLGEDPPARPSPVAPEPDLTVDFRRFAAENGFDPDEEDDDDDAE